MEGAGIGALLTALALVGNPHARETAGPTSPAAASEQYADFPPILLPESAAPMLPARACPAFAISRRGWCSMWGAAWRSTASADTAAG